eukprot:4023641-Pleurochrysis_carterae.AAC.1
MTNVIYTSAVRLASRATYSFPPTRRVQCASSWKPPAVVYSRKSAASAESAQRSSPIDTCV